MSANHRKRPTFQATRIRRNLATDPVNDRIGILTYPEDEDTVWSRLVKAIGTLAPGFLAKILVELICKIFLRK